MKSITSQDERPLTHRNQDQKNPQNSTPDSRLQDKLIKTPDDFDLAQQYLEESVQHHCLAQAEQTFAHILESFPHYQHIRRLFIACCLHQQKYHKAMDAIELLVTFSEIDEHLIRSALHVRNKIGPKVIPQERKDHATLSLCMIVKNEQASIGPCLNAAKNMVDEIVVVDTGSTDRTADIARIYGAVVYDFSWNDDFSEARNYTLDKAHGDWILVLDADELVAPRDRQRIRQLLNAENRRNVVFSFESRNYSHVANAVNLRANPGEYPRHEAGLGWFPSRKIMLFPNLKSIRFHFPVHERISPSVREAGLTVIDATIPVHHYGLLNETKNNKKGAVYFRIGYKKLDRLGNDVVALRELAIQAGQLAYWPEALELWQRLLTLRPDYAEAYVNMAAAYWQTGKYQQSLESARMACELAPQMKEGAYNLAVSLLMLGKAEKAVVVLTELLHRHGDYLAARFMLASAAGCAGDMDRCVSLYREFRKIQVGAALGAAVLDLQRRLRGSGLNPYADALDSAMRRMEG